ncbi:MAG TPA: FAD-dependent monooxygenase [Candidatus Cybelea sp.]
MSSPRVLIVGAGPTGLVLALNLTRRGVPFRIVADADGPGEQSRAMVVQARTLEFYRQLGFAEELIGEGIVVPHLHLREAAGYGRLHEMVRLNFTDLGDGISPYPFALTYPQDDHERFLTKKLDAAGIDVEWNTKLTALLRKDDGSVTATLTGPRGSEQLDVDYLCGCDGAHSAVRTALGLGFAGKTYDQLFFVCDAKVDAASDHDLYVTLGEYALMLMFAVRSTGMRRLIGLAPSGLAEGGAVTFESVRAYVEPLLGVHVTEVNWFATYRVHHRVAERFRSGRVFILGDAAHIHSPAGGQGMNTGIGDATNLGWKLADAVTGRSARTILDSYEEERIGFARALVATTDRAFTAMVAPGMRGRLTRSVLAPLLLAAGTRLASVRRLFFRVVSQTQIRYPDSSLSDGKAGGVRGGDRLPWVASLDNFAPLRSLDWQVHVYGDVGPQIAAAADRSGIPLHAFAWDAGARGAGLARNAAYLVRPDGYVALALRGDDGARFQSYVSRIGLVSVPASGPAP